MAATSLLIASAVVALCLVASSASAARRWVPNCSGTSYDGAVRVNLKAHKRKSYSITSKSQLSAIAKFRNLVIKKCRIDACQIDLWDVDQDLCVVNPLTYEFSVSSAIVAIEVADCINSVGFNLGRLRVLNAEDVSANPSCAITDWYMAENKKQSCGELCDSLGFECNDAGNQAANTFAKTLKAMSYAGFTSDDEPVDAVDANVVHEYKEFNIDNINNDYNTLAQFAAPKIFIFNEEGSQQAANTNSYSVGVPYVYRFNDVFSSANAGTCDMVPGRFLPTNRYFNDDRVDIRRVCCCGTNCPVE